MLSELAVSESQALSDYERVARAIAFIRSEARRHPSLDQIASSVEMSPFHLQRLFTRWAGVSPKRFLQYLTLEHARRLLAQSSDVLTATFETGLSSPGRLHDLFVTFEAMTPGEFKSAGAGLTIRYGVHDSPFGNVLVATTDRGICHLAFVDDPEISPRVMLRPLASAWPAASLVEDPARTAPLARQSFTLRSSTPLHLHVRGTNFQTQVWRALLSIPSGALSTYARIAAALGAPSASRAVGGAVGANPIAWLIPCHRVLRTDGSLGGYHWGEERKAACLAWEQAQMSRGGLESESNET